MAGIPFVGVVFEVRGRCWVEKLALTSASCRHILTPLAQGDGERFALPPRRRWRQVGNRAQAFAARGP